MSYSFSCSVPPDGVRFVSSPAVRGTLDIVWSCVGVFILVAWETLSFDEVYHSLGRTKREKLRWKIQLYGEKLWYMLVTILVPEAAAVEAAYNHFRSRQIYADGKHFAVMDGVDWTPPKVFLAMMRGFEIEWKETWTTPAVQATTTGRAHRTDDIDAEYRGAGGEDTQKLQPNMHAIEEMPSTRRLKVNGEQIIYLRRIGVLESLPSLTSEDIDDRNKSNVLVQFLASVQIFWLVLSVLVRNRQGFHVTQLEVVTLAFAALSFITRGLDWYKPRNIVTVTTLYANRCLTLSECEAFSSLQNVPVGSKIDISGDVLCCALGFIYGGLHCLAWNQQFPTTAEQTLWRVGSILLACIPAGLIVINKLNDIWIWLLGGTYALVRFLILFESVRGLFFQPPLTYVSTWAANIPHFG